MVVDEHEGNGMRLGWVGRIAACVAGLLLFCSAALAENRIALVIGNSNYQNVKVLPNPANDASAISQILTEAGFEVTAVVDQSLVDMRQSIQDFAAKVSEKGADTV